VFILSNVGLVYQYHSQVIGWKDLFPCETLLTHSLDVNITAAGRVS